MTNNDEIQQIISRLTVCDSLSLLEGRNVEPSSHSSYFIWGVKKFTLPWLVNLRVVLGWVTLLAGSRSDMPFQPEIMRQLIGKWIIRSRLQTVAPTIYYLISMCHTCGQGKFWINNFQLRQMLWIFLYWTFVLRQILVDFINLCA